MASNYLFKLCYIQREEWGSQSHLYSMPKLLEVREGTETKIIFRKCMSDVSPGSAKDHQSGFDYGGKSCKTKYSEKIVFLTM